MKPGDRLRLLREAKGLNKNRFCELVNKLGDTISSGHLSNLESGRANSEHVGNHYLRTFARALEVREHVMTSEIRDTAIENDATQVLVEEVLEVFLEQEGKSAVQSTDVAILRDLVARFGGPRWCSEWPAFYQRLKAYKTLSEQSSARTRNVADRPARSMRKTR